MNVRRRGLTSKTAAGNLDITPHTASRARFASKFRLLAAGTCTVLLGIASVLLVQGSTASGAATTSPNDITGVNCDALTVTVHKTGTIPTQPGSLELLQVIGAGGVGVDHELNDASGHYNLTATAPITAAQTSVTVQVGDPNGNVPRDFSAVETFASCTPNYAATASFTQTCPSGLESGNVTGTGLLAGQPANAFVKIAGTTVAQDNSSNADLQGNFTSSLLTFTPAAGITSYTAELDAPNGHLLASKVLSLVPCAVTTSSSAAPTTLADATYTHTGGTCTTMNETFTPVAEAHVTFFPSAAAQTVAPGQSAQFTAVADTAHGFAFAGGTSQEVSNLPNLLNPATCGSPSTTTSVTTSTTPTATSTSTATSTATDSGSGSSSASLTGGSSSTTGSTLALAGSGSTAGSGGTLASTGLDSSGLVVLGLSLIGAGSLLFLLVQRRRVDGPRHL